MHFVPIWSVAVVIVRGGWHDDCGNGAASLLTQTCAQYGRTALIFATENGHAECVRLLLNYGADKNAKNNVRSSVVIV